MSIKFKRLATVFASAILVSSSVALGLAANYPAPFVDNGQADVAVVYGANAPLDLAAVADVTADLQGEFAQQNAEGSSGPESGDDFVRLDKSSDRLNLGDNLNGPFGTSVNDDDMPGLLADGIYTNDENSDFDYEQEITLANASVFNHFRDSDYESEQGLDERTPVIGFKIGDGTTILNYTLDFLSNAESDAVSSDLVDFENTDIPILGKTYFVSNVDWTPSTGQIGPITLLDSANTAIVTEGETVTVSTDGASYDISISFVDSDETVLEVNGETTNTLNEGETYKLSDGTYVGVKDILFNSKDTGISKVEFSVGSGKLELTHGAEVELNDDAVNEVRAYILNASNNSGKATWDKLIIEWKSDDESFLTPDNDITIPGFGAIQLSFDGLVRNEEEKVVVQNDGTDSIELRVPIKDGEYGLNILYANSSGEFTGIGKAADERLATSSNGSLVYQSKVSSADYHEYFVATYNTTDDAESYVLSFKVTEDTSDNRNETTIKNEVTGETWDNRVAGDTFKLGDVSFTIDSLVKTSTTETVTISAGSGVNFNTIFTEGGLGIYLPWEEADNSSSKGGINLTNSLSGTSGHNVLEYYLFFEGENKDDDKGAGTGFNVSIDANTDSELQVDQVNNAGTGGPNGLEQGDSNTYETYVLDAAGPRTIHYTDPNQDYVEVYYPMGDSETYAEVYVSSPSAVIASGGSSELGSVAVSDSESASYAGKNLIVVGGSCVNSVAADLLGGSFCGDDFEGATGVGSGSFLIETFAQSGGKVATLVAGYNAGDTQNAATYLTTQDVDTSVGNKYVGSTATSASLVTA